MRSAEIMQPLRPQPVDSLANLRNRIDRLNLDTQVDPEGTIPYPGKSIVEFLDVVLVANPNPLGMIVRVFRHLCSKEARRVTSAAAQFLADATAKYSYGEIAGEERRRYGDVTIRRDIYRLFERMNDSKTADFSHGAMEIHRMELQLV